MIGCSQALETFVTLTFEVGDWDMGRATTNGYAPRQFAPSGSVRSHDPSVRDEGGVGTIARTRQAQPQLKEPPFYKVVLLNDDYTPMEFVIVVLMKFFRMDEEKAWQFMYAVHTTGSAVVGIFPRDIAETKSEQVNIYAQEHNHPLRSTVEVTD